MVEDEMMLSYLDFKKHVIFVVSHKLIDNKCDENRQPFLEKQCEKSA